METKYPTLRRPKRKLCYLANKESVSKQWAGTVTLGDVDRMFDDLDSSPLGDDVLASSPPPRRSRGNREASQKGDPTEKQSPCQKGPGANVPPPVRRSTSPKLEIDSEDLFKLDGPVKTSSPIEEKEGVADGGGSEEEDNDRIPVVSPILFDCEEEGNEVAKTMQPNAQEPQCNGNDSELQTPPNNFTLRKPSTSTHKDRVDGTRKESHPAEEEQHKKPKTPFAKGKGQKPMQDNGDKHAPAVRQEPELVAPEKLPASVYDPSVAETSARALKDMTVFLQKLRDAGQSKPACHRKSLTPVKVAVSPPEPEDDFLILEEDTPLWFTIPSKNATSKRQRPNTTSSTDKDSSADKGTKDGPQETAQREGESEEAKAVLGIEPVDQKKKRTKKKKGREKKKEVTRPENDKEELTSPEDLSAGDPVEQEKPNIKKRQLKKVPSKESEKAPEAPKETEKVGKKTQKSLKDGRGNAKTSRAKPPKRTRKVTRGPEDVNEAVPEEAVKEPGEDQDNEQQADVEDPASNSDKEVMNLDAANHSADGKATKGSSPEECPISGRRKRKPTGHWWLCSPETTEEANKRPTHKRPKQEDAEPTAAETSPAKTKKDNALKKRHRRRPPSPSSQTTTPAKEKKTQRNKKKPARGDSPNKTKAAEEVPNTSEAGQTKEQRQQDVPDQDLDSERSSPFVSTHTDHNLSSGGRVFQKVYHRASLSNSPAPVHPERPPEPLVAADPEKRRRKPPRSWWTVSEKPKEEQSISSQPQQPRLKEPKLTEKTNKRSKTKQSRSPGLGTPKNGNVPALSKPPGGAHVLLQKLKPMGAPKTVKRSLATFKDIFMSASETPTAASGRKERQRNTLGIAERPAEEAPAADCVTLVRAQEDGDNVDAGEFRSTQNSPPNQDVPPDDRCQPENTLEDLRSGPSAWSTEYEYENNDNLILPPCSVHTALSLSDFCSPPLRPLILQPKDKANLTEWFKSLWSPSVNKDSEITPDQFDWFFYQGRALGVLVDLQCGSFCNGKILLGSKTKKPLWVDHCATTVFNLLTSSVKVTVNGKKTLFDPGQSFMVQCGRAYSIENVTAQPAVLYFTRLLAESSD